MNDSQIVEKLFLTYKNSWLDAVNQNLVIKVQLEATSEDNQKKNERIEELTKQVEELKKQIHHLRTRAAQQQPKIEAK